MHRRSKAGVYLFPPVGSTASVNSVCVPSDNAREVSVYVLLVLPQIRNGYV